MKLTDVLTENAKKDEHKPVFKETDPEAPFPNDTIKALEREINKKAKDLERDWDCAISVVDSCFKDLKVPKPSPLVTKRWEQYEDLIADAVKQLYDARGLAGSWRQSGNIFKQFNK
jgi:hypothetical protein